MATEKELREAEASIRGIRSRISALIDKHGKEAFHEAFKFWLEEGGGNTPYDVSVEKLTAQLLAEFVDSGAAETYIERIRTLATGAASA